jgi:hypothetical protein
MNLGQQSKSTLFVIFSWTLPRKKCLAPLLLCRIFHPPLFWREKSKQKFSAKKQIFFYHLKNGNIR